MKDPQITPAQSLQEVYLTLRAEPLTTESELAAFYHSEMNAVRGGDKVQRRFGVHPLVVDTRKQSHHSYLQHENKNQIG
jgi:hypothetical protein